MSRGTAYDQLVRGTVLQELEDLLSPHGLELEFKHTTDIGKREDFSKASDYAVMRNKSLLEDVSDAIEGRSEEFKDFKNRVVLVSYTVSPMVTVIEDSPIVKDVSKRGKGGVCCNKAQVGLKVGKYKDITDEEWVAGEIPTYEEVFPHGVQIYEVDPLALVKAEEDTPSSNLFQVDTANIKEGYKPLGVYRDIVSVEFKVDISLITISEKTQRKINFILLKDSCDKRNTLNKVGILKYEFTKNQPFYANYIYTTDPIGSMGVLGSKDSARMYQVGFSKNITNAPLYSDYSYYKALKSDSSIVILLKLGFKQSIG